MKLGIVECGAWAPTADASCFIAITSPRGTRFLVRGLVRTKLTFSRLASLVEMASKPSESDVSSIHVPRNNN